MNWITFTIIALLFYAVGEIYSKIFADTGKIHWMVYGMVAYVICTALWFPALKNNNKMVVMTTLWTIGYVVIGTFVGLFIFHEHCSVQQFIGLGMAMISIVLLCV
jgi:multidrug transporter EmrE-like cation transporter